MYSFVYNSQYIYLRNTAITIQFDSESYGDYRLLHQTTAVSETSVYFANPSPLRSLIYAVRWSHKPPYFAYRCLFYIPYHSLGLRCNSQPQLWHFQTLHHAVCSIYYRVLKSDCLALICVWSLWGYPYCLVILLFFSMQKPFFFSVYWCERWSKFGLMKQKKKQF